MFDINNKYMNMTSSEALLILSKLSTSIVFIHVFNCVLFDTLLLIKSFSHDFDRNCRNSRHFVVWGYNYPSGPFNYHKRVI